MRQRPVPSGRVPDWSLEQAVRIAGWILMDSAGRVGKPNVGWMLGGQARMSLLT